MESLEGLFASAPAIPQEDFLTQAAKLAQGLLTTKYIRAVEEAPKKAEAMDVDGKEESDRPGTSKGAVRPGMFKNIVGRGHADFSSSNQQDSVEYFRHLIDFMW